MEINFEKYPLPKRLRHHTSPNLYFKYSDFKEKPDYYPDLYETIDWSKIFANGKPPDYIDLGCGKGFFLLQISELEKEKNILGIELRKSLVEWINNYVKGEKIPNAAALWYSIINGLYFIENESLEKVFYLFPDPWHKKKHFKRRAFNSGTVIEIYNKLKFGGKLYLATDVAEIDTYHKSILREFGKFDVNQVIVEEQWNLPPTNKESFCIKSYIPTFKLICEKK